MCTTDRYHNIRRTSAQTVTLAKFIEEMDRYARSPVVMLYVSPMAHDVSETKSWALLREVWLMMIDVQGLEAKILAAAASTASTAVGVPRELPSSDSSSTTTTIGGASEQGTSVLARGYVKMFLVGIHGSNIEAVEKHLRGAGYDILLSEAPGAFDAGEPDGLVWAVHSKWKRKKEILALARDLGVVRG